MQDADLLGGARRRQQGADLLGGARLAEEVEHGARPCLQHVIHVPHPSGFNSRPADTTRYSNSMELRRATVKGLARSKATSMPWKPTQRSKQKKDASASVFFL
jgi:hypothetical protein